MTREDEALFADVLEAMEITGLGPERGLVIKMAHAMARARSEKAYSEYLAELKASGDYATEA